MRKLTSPHHQMALPRLQRRCVLSYKYTATSLRFNTYSLLQNLSATTGGFPLFTSTSASAASAAPQAQPPHENKKERLVLGIESSCDDTGVAVVSTSGRILGESLATQVDVHAGWGGVVPKLAEEAHQAAIDACVQEALDKAGITADNLDAVAVTIGPGLSLCLRVGVLKAREIAANAHLPLIPIHHMEAHALVARLPHMAVPTTVPQPTTTTAVQFPFLCVLISGGHNLLLIVEGIGRYVQLGTTLDDALGEAYDKVARLLGLDLRPSGGAALEALAREGNPLAFPFTQPMRKRPTCDFSYAGLKTAVRLAIEETLGGVEMAMKDDEYEEENEDEDGGAGNNEQYPSTTTSTTRRQLRADIAASFQHVAVKHLEDRCRRALTWVAESHPNQIRQLVVAGGVASNSHVRSRLTVIAEEAGVELVCPPPRLCTDNGVMVGWAGVERLRLGVGVEEAPTSGVAGEGEWVDLRPRWPLTDRKDPRAFQAPRSAKKKNIFASLEKLMEEEGEGADAVPVPVTAQQQ